MIVKLLTEHHYEFLSFTGGCRGSSESTLVKMSNCWKSHAAAHISYRNDRSDGKGGGLFLLVSNKNKRQEPEELKVGEDCELVWAKVKSQCSKNLYIGSFYKPPDKQKPGYLEQLQRYLSRNTNSK